MPPKRKKVRPSFTVAVEVAPLRDQLQDLVKHPARAFDGDGPTPCALWQAALDAVDRESKRRAKIGTQSLLGSLAPELLTHILSLITDWSTPWTSSALNVVLGTNRAFLALRPEVLREWCARYLFSEVSFPSDSTVFASASFLDFESEALRLVETASDPSALRRLLLTCQGPEWYRRRSPPAIHPVCFGVDLEYLLEGVNQRVIFGVCGCGETDEDPIDTWQLAGRGFFPEFQSWKAQLDASKPLHRRDQRCPWCSSTESYTILNDTAKVAALSASPSFMGSRALIKWLRIHQLHLQLDPWEERCCGIAVVACSNGHLAGKVTVTDVRDRPLVEVPTVFVPDHDEDFSGADGEQRDAYKLTREIHKTVCRLYELDRPQ